MKATESSELGVNKTGASMSPMDSLKMANGAEELTMPPSGDSSLIGQNRLQYIEESDPLGTVPFPATLKGALSALQEKLKMGDHLFMNKLGERLAFERSGTRLYEALLIKHRGAEESESLPPLEFLVQFHQDELNHFKLLWNAIKEVGGDPTAVTPCADVAAMASMGWVQVLTDPRTSFAQCLDVMLMAELADNDGWEVLIQLSEAIGLSDLAERFRSALEEEDNHLMHVRRWVQALSLGTRDFDSSPQIQ